QANTSNLTGAVAGNVTVRASSGSLATADTSFTVTSGDAAAVAFVSPNTTDLQSGSTRTFTARIRDAAGNTVTGYSGSISFASPAGPGTVTGLPSIVAVTSGTATSGTITAVNVGDVTVRASSGSLATADTSFTVTPVPVTVSITGGPFAYNGNPHAATVTTTPSITGYSVNYAGTTTAYNSSTPPTNSDTYTVTVTITDPNYVLSGSATGSITINKVALTASIIGIPTKQYDGNATATVSFSGAALVGVVGLDAVTINSAGYSATFADKTVANGKPVTVTGVALSGADAGNYTVSQPTGLTANITAKNLTINGAVANNKQYDIGRTARRE